MNWIIFASLSIVSISIANIFQKIAMNKKDSDPIVSSIVFQFLLSLITGVYALIKGFQLPNLDSNILYFILSSILYAFGTLLVFKAIKIIEASELTIIATFGSLATIFSAYLFLGERLNPFQLLGVAVIFTSVFIINYSRKKFEVNQGFYYALLGYTLYGLAVTSDTFILRSFDAVSFTPIMSFLPGLWLCLVYPRKAKSIALNLKKSIDRNLVVYCFFYGIQAVSYYLSIENGAMASQISAIFKTEMVLTIILSVLYLRERKNILRKIIAALLALIGVKLIV